MREVGLGGRVPELVMLVVGRLIVETLFGLRRIERGGGGGGGGGAAAAAAAELLDEEAESRSSEEVVDAVFTRLLVGEAMPLMLPRRCSINDLCFCLVGIADRGWSTWETLSCLFEKPVATGETGVGLV